jgi:hypothetical protein
VSPHLKVKTMDTMCLDLDTPNILFSDNDTLQNMFSSTLWTQEEHKETNILSADNTSVEQIMTSDNVKQLILANLRRVVPNRGVFQLLGFTIDIIIYDFFFEDSKLKMFFILLESGELFEAESFYLDFRHLITNLDKYIDTKTSETSLCHEFNTTFHGFYIKTKLGYAHLENEIWSSVRNGIFSDATKHWLEGKFLDVAETTTPIEYISIPLHMLLSSNHQPRFPMTPIPHVKCTEPNCMCLLLQQKYQYEFELCQRSKKIKIKDILKQIRSSIDYSLKLYIAPCVKAIRQQKYNSKICYKSNYKKQCLGSPTCTERPCVIFHKCCSIRHPLFCKTHAKKFKKKHKLLRCPRHNYYGKMLLVME